MAGSRQSKGAWAPAIVAGAAGLALFLALFRVPKDPATPPRTSAGPVLSLMPPEAGATDAAFSEDTALHDPTPLFLPTRWNSTGKDISRGGSDIAFAGYGPNFAFDESGLHLRLAAPAAIPERPADALDRDPPGHPFLGIGRAPVTVPELPARGAYVRIVAARTGLPVLEEALTDIPPRAADSPPEGGAWQFTAEVDPAGLVGPLVQTVRSGTPSDGYFADYLTRKLRVGERLPAGLYRISLGP